MSISGSVPAHAYYGRPVGGQRLAAVEGARIATASAPYVGRGNKCSANEDTCEGIRAKGTEYCMGHIRKFKPAISGDKEVTDGVRDDDGDAVA
jgi:hypothetical protein